MEWWLILIIAFGLLVALFCMGLPIAFSFLALDIVGLYLLFGEKGMGLLSNSIFDSVASFTMSPIPLFILLGEIFYQSKVVNYAFDAIDKWVGGFRARLHIVTLIFATIFGAISGAAMAMAAMLGTTVLPEMNKRGYDKQLSMGVIMGGACLDPLIPPSILAVLIGSLANVSIAKLLISGTGPGLVLAGLLIIYVLIAVKINPKLAPVDTSSSSFREKMVSLLLFLPFILIIFLIMGLMLIGVATPTESAAVGVIASIVMAICYRKLTFQMLKDSLVGTVKVSGMILLIIAGSKAFSQVLAISGATRGLVELVVGFKLSPLALLALMQAIPLLLGCFIEQMAIMMITIPVYLPVIATSGFDPIWFWCLFLINMTVGAITPPFGNILFVLKATSPETTLEEVYRAAVPFIFIILFCMLLLVIFPQIALWLPNLMVQ
jgi:tripartite ATP-independent transporter DctM subunit